MSKVWVSGNKFLEAITNKEITEHFSGNGVDAMWTRHIAKINEELKSTTYKAGRPKKVEQSIESEMSM